MIWPCRRGAPSRSLASRLMAVVQQDHGRAVHQGAADAGALLLAAGQRVRMALAELAQAELVQHRLHAFAHFADGTLRSLSG